MEYTYWSDMRRHYPHAGLESRVMHCPDGVSRVITATHWTWDAMDLFTEKLMPEKEIVETCFEQALKGHKKAGLDITVAFEQYFAYFISEVFKSYCHVYGDDRRLVLGIRHSGDV